MKSFLCLQSIEPKTDFRIDFICMLLVCHDSVIDNTEYGGSVDVLDEYVFSELQGAWVKCLLY